MEKYQHYLHDVGFNLKKRAFEAKQARDAAPIGGEERTFQAGRVMGFNEALSILQQDALGFGVSLRELQLDDLDPDRDLV